MEPSILIALAFINAGLCGMSMGERSSGLAAVPFLIAAGFIGWAIGGSLR